MRITWKENTGDPLPLKSSIEEPHKFGPSNKLRKSEKSNIPKLLQIAFPGA